MSVNEQIINETAALTTQVLGSGLLTAEQSKEFLQLACEASPLSSLVRHEIRRSRVGTIDKIGAASRILRPKAEGVDDGYRALPAFGAVPYETTAVRLPWEITEDALRSNIEAASLEDAVTLLMTRQLGADREDLCLNGDSSVPDDEFLSVNDGWLKQLSIDGIIYDHSGSISFDMFYNALALIPNKYNNGNLRWIMSPRTRQEWERSLLAQALDHSGFIGDRHAECPAGIPIVEAPAMPDSKIILSDPMNLIIVSTYDVVIRKTTEGRDAIMCDKRYYVVHFDFDPVIENPQAAVLLCK